MTKDPNETSGPENRSGSLPETDPSVLQAITDAKISNAHYSAIGQVAANWAFLEIVIDSWLWALIDRPPLLGVCLTAQMLGSRPRVDAFIALVRQLGARKNWNDDLEALAKDIVGLSEQRNRAVHDIWDMREPTQPIRREASARRTVRLINIHVPTDELLALGENIKALAVRFDNLGV
jgi:hypothetical protein